MNFLLANIQTNSQNNINQNYDNLVVKMQEAKNKGCSIVATPENVFCMQSEKKEIMGNLYLMHEHPILHKIRQKCKDLSIWLLVGSVPIIEENTGKPYNRSILIDSDGNIACYYDKIHLYDASVKKGETHKESDSYARGDKIVTYQTPWIKVGLSICYDLRFPYLYRKLALAGAELIFTPSAFTEYTGKLHWEILNRSRAIENLCYVVAPAQHGKHPANRLTYGHSMVIDPMGKILANAYDYKAITLAQIDADKVIGTREQILSLKHGVDLASILPSNDRTVKIP